LVNFSKASFAMLKPEPAVSIAVKLIVVPVVGLVKLQHPPQLVELKATSKAPPMKGNEGKLPKVGNHDASQLTPLEHATLFIEPARLSNVVSNVTRAVMVGGGSDDALGVDDGPHECAGEPEAGA
jgi:hypothetical protein